MPSSPRKGSEAILTSMLGTRSPAGDAQFESNEHATKIIKLEKTGSHGIVNTTVKLSKLCHSCTALGNELYGKRLQEKIQISIIKHPSDATCVLCTMLNEKAEFTRKQYGLKPSSSFDLKSSSLYGDGKVRALRFSNVDIDRLGTSIKSERGTLHFRHFPPEECHEQALVLRPFEVKYDIIRYCLEFCGAHHNTLCNAVSAESWNGPSDLMVMDCDENRMVMLPHGSSRYVTLSYVWGTSSPLCQLELGSHINVTQLERTIRDTITVTLQLGLRYLWVDRYCISQRDINEKHLQIQQMGEIYANSYLTVIACAGKDAEAGLPGVGATPRNNNLSVLAQTWSLQNDYLLDTYSEIDESVWSTRGWTFQEGLLAKRRLVFTDSKVYFQCMAMHHDENNTNELASLHTKNLERFRDKSFGTTIFPRYGVGKVVQDIIPLISQYLTRRFSYYTDTLDAFLGILFIFQKSKALVGHVGGLPIFPPGTWKNTNTYTLLEMFIYSLAWKMEPCKREGDIIRRPGFPSWTWTGWRRTGKEVTKSFQYRNLRAPIVMIQFEPESIAELPAPFNLGLKAQDCATHPTRLEISAWSAKLSIQDGTKLPYVSGDPGLFMHHGIPIVIRDLAILAIDYFQSLRCSTLDFEDIILVPVLGGLYMALWPTLILCYDSNANGYVRLPYELVLRGDMGDEKGNKMLLRSGGNAIAFERRTITLV